MLRSVALQLAGSLVCAVVSFALVVFLGRALGADDFGRYAALLSAAVVALPLIEGGWAARLYRSSVSSPATPVPEASPSHASAHVLTAGVALIAFAAMLSALSGWSTPAMAASAAACMGVVAACNLISARMRGAGRFGLESAWRVAGRCVSALAIVAVVLVASNFIAGIFLAWALGLLLVFAWFAPRWSAPPRWLGLAAEYPRLLPLLGLEVFLAVLSRGDSALAAASGLGPEPLSFYAACARVLEAAILMFAPYTAVLLRNLRLGHEHAGYAIELRRALVVSVVFGTGMLILAIAAGEKIMPLLFGPEFAPAGALLPWVALSLPLMFANQVWVQGVLAQQREHQLPWRLAVAALAATASIAAGVQWGEARGVAIGLLIGQIVLALLLAPLARTGTR